MVFFQAYGTTETSSFYPRTPHGFQNFEIIGNRKKMIAENQLLRTDDIIEKC